MGIALGRSDDRVGALEGNTEGLADGDVGDRVGTMVGGAEPGKHDVDPGFEN